jgi:hypothetical protein
VSTRELVGAQRSNGAPPWEEGNVASILTLWLNGKVNKLQEVMVEFWAS